MNPVLGKLVKNTKQCSWSSAAAHIENKNDTLVNAEPLMSIVQKNWTDFLSQPITFEEQKNLQKHVSFLFAVNAPQFRQNSAPSWGF